MTAPTMTERLAEVEGRVEQARADYDAIQGYEESSLSERIALQHAAERVYQLTDDVEALVAVVKAVQAARGDLNHHHAHMVPGQWDKDGSHCDVCARVGAMDEALNSLGER